LGLPYCRRRRCRHRERFAVWLIASTRLTLVDTPDVPIGRAWRRSSGDIRCARSVRRCRARIGSDALELLPSARRQRQRVELLAHERGGFKVPLLGRAIIRRGVFGASKDEGDSPLFVRDRAHESRHGGRFLADEAVTMVVEGSNRQFDPRVIGVVVEGRFAPRTLMRPAEELPANRERHRTRLFPGPAGSLSSVTLLPPLLTAHVANRTIA
jgi:hypothetical protein